MTARASPVAFSMLMPDAEPALVQRWATRVEFRHQYARARRGAEKPDKSARNRLCWPRACGLRPRVFGVPKRTRARRVSHMICENREG